MKRKIYLLVYKGKPIVAALFKDSLNSYRDKAIRKLKDKGTVVKVKDFDVLPLPLGEEILSDVHVIGAQLDNTPADEIIDYEYGTQDQVSRTYQNILTKGAKNAYHIYRPNIIVGSMSRDKPIVRVAPL